MPNIPLMANAIRMLAIDSIVRAGEGHQGVPLGMAEIAATLYANYLNVDPVHPTWPDRDRVVLSNGHGSMLLYTLLHLAGYNSVDTDALKNFRQLHAVCAGHPEIEQHAGIEMTTGLLGQGIASAVGMAVAEARLAARFGNDLVDHRTWAFVGDGCLQEGMGQEAISLAGHLQLGKLTFLWDDNHITDDGDTSLAISEDIPTRFTAANWHVEQVDGHDPDAIDAALQRAIGDPRPSIIACRTTIAKGIPRLQGQRGGHSAPISEVDAHDARAYLGWDAEPFVVPDDIYRDWADAMNRGKQKRADWDERLASHAERDEFQRWMSGKLPADWNGMQTGHRTVDNAAPQPTISASGSVCDSLIDVLPETIVLCADLEAPTNHKRSREAFTASNRRGSYVHCGVREHLMGAMVNGICAHGGLRPVNVTYLAFADYERAAMRMAALMDLPALFVFSHDSIGVGSNGPTHQPVEVLASFRAMPNMRVFRPADAVETAEAWQLAMQAERGPSLIALSRQPAEPVRNLANSNNINRLSHGAYVLHEPDGERDVTLLATGTEVGIAVQAREQLATDGIRAAVISMPCWELFDAQSEQYRQHVLGAAPRIGIEASVRFGWEKWLQGDDAFIGMTGFGASATGSVLYKHFGITAERVVEVTRQILG